MAKQRFGELGEHELFSTCRRSTLARVDQLGYSLDVEPGRVLCREGAYGAEFFILVGGLLEVCTASGASALLRPGAWFGETALLDDGLRHATVTARTHATLLVFNRLEFSELLRIVPGMRRRLEAMSTKVVAGTRPTAQPWYQPLPQSMLATAPCTRWVTT
jgi:CRP-like cAMP-binding protein